MDVGGGRYDLFQNRVAGRGDGVAGHGITARSVDRFLVHVVALLLVRRIALPMLRIIPVPVLLPALRGRRRRIAAPSGTCHAG